MIPVLERIQKTNQPRRLGSRQDISLDENMLDLIHLGQRSLFHLFQGANFASIRLSGEEDGSISTLSHLLLDLDD